MSARITLLDALLLAGGLWAVIAWIKHRLLNSGVRPDPHQEGSGDAGN
ncbi:MAG: hypothetical protein HQL98_06685 [Magnetococcales bacterium]|nr:hypothetical protein [Magnetococcales bacterium]